MQRALSKADQEELALLLTTWTAKELAVELIMVRRERDEAVLSGQHERQMWINAIATVAANPEDLRLIGGPGSDNDVRSALTLLVKTAHPRGTSDG